MLLGVFNQEIKEIDVCVFKMAKIIE